MSSKITHARISTYEIRKPQSGAVQLESTSVEHAIRLAVSLGGDSDTMACIAGAIAEPFYGGVSEDLWTPARDRLDPHLIETVDAFRRRFEIA